MPPTRLGPPSHGGERGAGPGNWPRFSQAKVNDPPVTARRVQLLVFYARPTRLRLTFPHCGRTETCSTCMSIRYFVILIIMGMLIALGSVGCWQDPAPLSNKVICMDDEIAGAPDCDRFTTPEESARLDLNGRQLTQAEDS